MEHVSSHQESPRYQILEVKIHIDSSTLQQNASVCEVVKQTHRSPVYIQERTEAKRDPVTQPRSLRYTKGETKDHWTTKHNIRQMLAALLLSLGIVRGSVVACPTYKREIAGSIPGWAELCSDVAFLGKALCPYVHSLDPGVNGYLVGQ